MTSLGAFFALLGLAFCTAYAQAEAPAPAKSAKVQPNIVIIYADDLGYGDLGCYGARTVQTPNVDRLAREGLKFTEGYASSATCTPSRYSLLTGEYAFRKRGTGVLPGDAAMIIESGRLTLPALLQRGGYRTGAVGKWHLGLGATKVGLDWNRPISPGPREVGFHDSFIMAATGDRVPCVYVENGCVVGLDPADPIEVDYQKPFPGLPTGKENREALVQDWSHGHNMAVVNGTGRIGYMKGGKAALWKDEDMADTFTRKAVEFIRLHQKRPFFLYFATHDVHVPRVPHPRFAGRTTMGPRGDAIVQFDACVGEILRRLEEFKLAEKTLVILTSDNGPVLDDGYKDGAVENAGGHKPAGPLRGGKYSIFEGGTRVPFIVRWPGRVKPGESKALISQVDFCASLGSLAGQQPDPASSPDSVNILPALLGDSEVGRDHIVEHAGQIALREGNWKLIPPRRGAKVSAYTNVELGNDPKPQLFDLSEDIGETKDVAGENKKRVAEMTAHLNSLRGDGKSNEAVQ